MKKVLITGGNGYIAKSLYVALRTKYDITVVTRQDFNLLDYQATTAYLQDKYFDFIIHTAIVGGNRLREEDANTLAQNLSMHYNLIENKDRFGRLISFGSGAELNWPATPYGFSKRIIAESMLNTNYCLNLRIFAVFDENELDRRFIKSNIIRYINQEDMRIHENKRMDFFYMKDLITLVDYHLKRDEWLFKEVDCVYEKSFTLLEIAKMINQLEDYKVEIKVENLTESSYTGLYKDLKIPLIGLQNGIAEVYKKLKQT